MLKALELIGFKSFADKTRFEFPAGITVVVGPNGSGKSNIVDAIKWVLGEQSAKSLRGKDMADVIFKGSGQRGRRPVNTAEATIVIENSDSRLAIDAPEVHVTRRVFRSGEGEYLINGQPCRLKDIRDLFRGTGVGTDAYSLIEQGKVDQLLQASPRDRRAIFEEAAGISRFKAKKIEAQRRLERVDQNMLRLSDIVDEVESRLRSVRAQAAKARRYKEYSERLQQLRTHVGLTDWRKLTRKLQAIESQLQELQQQAATARAEIESIEAHSLEAELQIGKAGDALRDCQARSAHNGQRIAQHESTSQHQRNRSRELEEEVARLRRQLAALSSRAGDLNQQLHETAALLQTARQEHEQIDLRLADQHRQLDQLESQQEQLRDENEARRHEYVELTRQAAALGNQVEACQSKQTSAEQTSERCEARLERLIQECRQNAEQLAQRQADQQRLAEQVESEEAALTSTQALLATSRQQLTRRLEERSRLQSRFSAARERASVLGELEKNLEGISTGVREILNQARQAKDGAFSEVRGLVADQIHANVETAPLVDLVLGEIAQYVVVTGDGVIKLLQSGGYRPSGRIGLVPLDLPPGETTGSESADLSGQEGVMGRLDRLLECKPGCEALIRRLLDDVWLVEDLERALQLSTGRNVRLVTRAGQLLLPDGTLIAGPKATASGLVTRRSELRSLQTEIDQLTQENSLLEEQLENLQQEIQRQDARAEELTRQRQQSEAELADARLHTRELQQRQQQLQQEQQAQQEQLVAARDQHQAAEQELTRTQEKLATVETRHHQVEAEIERFEGESRRIDRQRQHCVQQATAAEVELATSRQRLDGLQSAMTRFQEDQRERSRAIQELDTQLAACIGRNAQSQHLILRATSELAELYLQKEALAEDAEQLVAQRQQLEQQRVQLTEKSQKQRKTLRGIEQQQHQKELAAGEIRHQRDALAERMRDDYGIELAEIVHAPSQEEQRQREEVEEEIASLRRKINNIGAVNLDALAELEELESRFGALSAQHRDLSQAKEALERIIDKINADSRRLFIETLEAIRTNFHALYRRAFGGGRADIVLEDGVDVLESGVEILTTPPGKPQFSNSLLSGGEKALTAVSLLLAIFQYRPSPFCILDEVDAPFDEANIGRFIDVLKEFLGWTKFIIVTHSKKTMTSATTLYGVTMQESGVSKRVSVKFEDVSEDGHISREAIEREESADADGDDDDERGAA